MREFIGRLARSPVVWWLAWLVAVLPIVWRRITTSDAWWHVALGHWMWRHHGAPDFAQWYFTPVRTAVPDLRWTWLGDLAMALAHAAGGAVGLQTLTLACLFGASFLLRDLARRSETPSRWTWAWLVVLSVGTYQTQLPRNAVFSLPLLAATFWILVTKRGWWWLVALAGLWSVLHGSYPLAVVVPALWLAGEVIDDFRAAAPGRWRQAGKAALVVAVCIAVVAVGNPSAGRLLAGPFRNALRAPVQAAVAMIDDDAAAAPRAAVATPKPQGVKRWFNGLLWSAGPGGVRSGDFASPFDRWSYRAVPVAFALGLLAALRLALAARWRWSWGLVVVGVAQRGCTYLRMIGYLAVGAVACLLAGPPLRPPLGRLAARLAPVGIGAVALAAVAGWMLAANGRLGSVLGKASHEFGCGAVPTFDERTAAWVLATFPQERTFTTIVTGSYAELVWAGRKPVFTDGFFAPHPTTMWEDYRRALLDETPARLRERYGIELALIENTRTDWNNLFLNSPEWRPAAIGAGTMVYALRSSAAGAGTPRLLVGAEDGARLTPFFRHALATNYFSALLALTLAGETEHARALRAADPALFEFLRPHLAPTQRPAAEAVARALDGLLEIHRKPPY